MERGWWHFWRKMLDDPLWEPERPRTKFEAWIYLVSKAKGRPGRELVGTSMIPLERGQLVFSIKGLAEKWGWSRGKVRRFISTLEEEGRASVNRGCSEGDSKPDTQTDTPYSILIICNYDYYNPLPNKTDTQTDTKRTPSGHPADTYNKERRKEGKKDKYGEEVEEVFKAYSVITQIRSRSESRKSKIRARLKEYGRDDLLRAIKNYNQVLTDPNHYWTHRFPIDKFMTAENVDRFLHMSESKGKVKDESRPFDIMTPNRIAEDATSFLMRAGRGEIEYEHFETAILKRYEGQTVSPQAIHEAYELALREFGTNEG